MNKYRNKKLTESARNESCVSCGNPNACWCHSNSIDHGKGRGTKSHDLFGFYGCLNCHDWYDGRSTIEPPSYKGEKHPWNDGKYDWFIEMWQRSLLIACERGYL